MDPKARGRGIGHALLARVEGKVRARGGRLLLIETSDTSAYASARRLYETSGYCLEAVVRDFYAPGDNLLIFTKNLGPIQIPQEALGAYETAASDLIAESTGPISR